MSEIISYEGNEKKNSSLVSAAENARVKAQAPYIVAMQRPRNVEKSRQRILDSCSRLSFAEKALYQKPMGNNKYVEGPSIRFAEEAIRQFGNIRTEVIVTYEDDQERHALVEITDLEANTSFAKAIVIKKIVERKSAKGRDVISSRTNSYGETVYIVVATDDEVTVKESALVAKIIRNEGLRLIPADIIEDAQERIKEVLRSKIDKDPKSEMRKLTDAFKELHVPVDELVKYLNHDIETITPAEIIDLRKIFTTIRSGEATWRDYMGTEEQSNDVSDDVAEKIKNKLKEKHNG